MVKILPPKVRGSTDPYYPHCLIVPLDKAHRTFPNVSGDVPPQTYWRYDTRKRRVVSMVTVDNGVNVAWDTCGVCMGSLRKCSCRTGFHAPDYIWRIAGGRPKKPEVVSLPTRLALGRTMPVPQKESRKFVHFTPPRQVTGAEIVRMGAKLTLRRKVKLQEVEPHTNGGFKMMKRRTR